MSTMFANDNRVSELSNMVAGVCVSSNRAPIVRTHHRLASRVDDNILAVQTYFLQVIHSADIVEFKKLTINGATA